MKAEDRAWRIEQLASPRKLNAACVLVLIHERPGHGYDLVQRLQALGAACKPAAVYRSLRWLEDAGLAEPTWVTSDRVGPARRVYSVTPAATAALCDARPALRSQCTSRDDRLAKYLLRRLGALERAGETFAFTVSAVFSVEALDGASGRRKLELVFAGRRQIAPDVYSTGCASISASGPGSATAGADAEA